MSGKCEAQTSSYLRTWSKCQSRRSRFLIQPMKTDMLCFHYWAKQNSTKAWRSVCRFDCALSHCETTLFPLAPHINHYLFLQNSAQLYKLYFITKPPNLLTAHCWIPLPLLSLQTDVLPRYERAFCSVTWLSSWHFASICKMELIIPPSTACCTF